MTAVPAEKWVPPADFYHCQKVYELMLARSYVVRINKTEDPERHTEQGDMVVYEGSLTALITEDLHLSTPYYTKLLRLLKGMGCVRQLRRGGGTSPSQWEMQTEPTEELFQFCIENNSRLASSKPSRYEALEQQVRDMNERVLKIEAILSQFIQGATEATDG